MAEPVLDMWEDVWIGDYLGTVVGVSEPLKIGNLRDENGRHPHGREYIIFIEEDE